MFQRPSVASASSSPNASSAMNDGCVCAWLRASFIVVGSAASAFEPESPEPEAQPAMVRAATPTTADACSRRVIFIPDAPLHADEHLAAQFGSPVGGRMRRGAPGRARAVSVTEYPEVPRLHQSTQELFALATSCQLLS